MRPLKRLFALATHLALLVSTAALAAPAAIVEMVQSPAWRDRGGVSAPLAPGMELKSGDVLRTGPSARAYLMLAEGSRVKLGEAAQFTLHTRSLRPEKSFHGALDVLAGAFRFTTAKLRSPRAHDLAIRVGTSTIGIRGTDLWGRANADGDLVALIEGQIEIIRAGQVAALIQPMSYFDAPRGKAGEVKALDPEVFRKLARETEILAGDGAAGASGAWRVLAGSFGSQEAALEQYDKVREAGFAARIRPLAAQPEGWRYEVLLGGFASADEAAVAAARLKAATGLKTSVAR